MNDEPQFSHAFSQACSLSYLMAAFQAFLISRDYGDINKIRWLMNDEPQFSYALFSGR